MNNKKAILSTLWIFVIANYIYCDILSNMEPEILKVIIEGGQFPGLPPITQKFLLIAGILMEIPIAMILLSRVLKYKANRVANIIAGSIMTILQISSLFLGTASLHYIFFSVIEISCTAFIVLYSVRWTIEKESSQ
jgi:hypothetical protein